MKKRIAGIISIIFIALCLAYIIYDISTGKSDAIDAPVEDAVETITTNWYIDQEIEIEHGSLNAVAVTNEFNAICGGDSFLARYDSAFRLLWQVATPEPVFALCESEGIIYAASQEDIYLFSMAGDSIDTWGPYDEDPILTGISANKNYVAFADAGNQLVFVCDRKGALLSVIGYPGNQFIIPSAYFDVQLTPDNELAIANTGKRQIEFRSIEGELLRSFGQEGDSWSEFCGCCNPSHFAFTSDGYIVTAEKGINRLKVLDMDGMLVEPVAQPRGFMASIPVDISVAPDNSIYAANRNDSKLYVFRSLN